VGSIGGGQYGLRPVTWFDTRTIFTTFSSAAGGLALDVSQLRTSRSRSGQRTAQHGAILQSYLSNSCCRVQMTAPVPVGLALGRRVHVDKRSQSCDRAVSWLSTRFVGLRLRTSRHGTSAPAYRWELRQSTRHYKTPSTWIILSARFAVSGLESRVQQLPKSSNSLLSCPFQAPRSGRQGSR
jgi:hypothetical protein